MINYKNRNYVTSKDPRLGEAMDHLAQMIENLTKNTNVNPNGDASPPPQITALNVTAAGGIFDIAIVDNRSPVSRGINYFVEYSTSPQFVAPHVIDLGASRNWRGLLGNITLYFRAYSAYPTSPRSAPTYCGTQTDPSAILGGGTTTGPAPLASSGSGTSSGASPSDGGFGNNQTRQ